MGLTPSKGRRANPRATFNRIQQGVNQAVIVGLQRVGNKIIIQASKNLKSKSPFPSVATGELLSKFFLRVNKRELTVTVGNSAPHALNVEFGRRAGAKPPPPRFIKDWLMAKGLPSDPKTVFLMGRKIARYGIKPTHFMRRATDDVTKEAPTIINEAIDEFLNKEGISR